MKIELHNLDCFYLLPSISYCNDISWSGYRSISLCFLKWDISFIIK